MPLTNPPATLRTLALECVQHVLQDLTHPAFPAGLSGEAETTRYKAIITWAKTGEEIAAGEWSDTRLHEFVQHCIARADTCEDVLHAA